MEKSIRQLLIIIPILIALWVIFRVVVSKKHTGKVSAKSEFVLFLFFVYLISVMSLTVIPLPISSFEKPSHGGINIIPVKNIIMGIANMLFPQKTFETDNIGENLFGNILMFIPLGIFLPLLSPRFRSIQKVTLFALMASTAIELTQLSLRLIEIYRFVDIDDVILNTTGAAIGFTILDKVFLSKQK